MGWVEFEGTSYRVRANETVLEALLRGGANISFSCREGSCQVCMLQAKGGQVHGTATAGLAPALVQAGMFLPCRARAPDQPVQIQRPDPADLFWRAHVRSKEWLSSCVCRFRLESEAARSWRPGQFVNVRRSDGVVRSYSIASSPEREGVIELHVKRLPSGVVSRWLCDEVSVGDVLEVQGPLGTCCYDPRLRERDLLLLGTGSGLSPLLGIAREALSAGHQGRIELFHGSRFADGLYLRDALAALAAEHESFSYTACLSEQPVPSGAVPGRVVDLACERFPDMRGWVAYLCGVPEMVYEGRYRLTLRGVERDDVHADPFEFAHAFVPADKAKIEALPPEPELWAALEHGAGLTRVLEDFYARVYEDPRLAPFFHGVTRRRAIEKQYSFLTDLFTGRADFFGLRPFNAHHWMVISDELFDHREALFEDCLRRHGLPPRLLRRWRAVHELFRREIVKSRARGLFIDGVEHDQEGHSEIVLDVGAICDGCEGELPPGARGRYHERTGALFCANCAAEEPAPGR